MINTFIILLFLPLLSLANPEGKLIPMGMFENAVRRDALPQEKYGIVKIITTFANKSAGRCTGYFVKNENNRFFIASAQHCAKYDFAKYCNSEGVTVSTASGNFKGHCESVIISNEKSDFVIFEARFANPEQVKRHIKFLTLAGTVPFIGTQLKLIGYPGDEERKGQLTVTEKCSIVKSNRTAMQEMTKEDFALLKGKKPAPKKPVQPQKPKPVDPEYELAKKRAADIKKYSVKELHNCSVFGGNSGGPLLIHGTDIVVGMPMNYLHLPVTRKFSAGSGMHFETTQSFIQRNRRAFEDYKITIPNKVFGIII